MSKPVTHLPTLVLVSLLVMAIALGLAASQAWASQEALAVSDASLQAQAVKVYPSKKAAKKAVVAEVRARWSKSKPKVKVELATKKKDMTYDQLASYQKGLVEMRAKPGKYKFFFTTFTSPHFTVSAKYKNAKDRVKTYSLNTTFGPSYATTINDPVDKDGSSIEDAVVSLDYDSLSYHKVWDLFAVRKGSGAVKAFVSAPEEHTTLTRTRRKKSATVYVYTGLNSAAAPFTLKA